MCEFKRTGITSIKVGDKHYWIPFLPAKDDKMKVLLPTGGSDFILISSFEDLVSWFIKAFPNAVLECRNAEKLKPVEKKDIKCPKCGCKEFTKNGFNLKGEQRYMCKHCFKTFIPEQSNSQEYSPLNT
jgi:DNA-directed RNA polymerase subunit RPC12/RpoP